MEKNELYDVTFKCPLFCIMSGSSVSGKTSKLLEILELKDVICSENSTKFITSIQPGRVFTIK